MSLTPSTMIELGSPLPAFRLPDADGKEVDSADFAGRPVLVAFICNHCPFVKHIADAFADFAREYQAKGLAVVAINSNDFHTHPDDRPERMREEVDARGYTFDYLVDESQDVARAFEAACTPDFFLFDHEHRLAYRGQFDASRPSKETPVTGDDLRAAADAVLADRAPAAQQTPSMGCNIKWK
ncbi:AhpC/TSA family protein [Chromohalobacter marismortui]|uniref:AhpC/TSA family protein n=1 Tax=Chromohalobacter marismortui TaxID=42055 RepID=A0A4R7NMQ2_9GAMM|nr:MULTISPECIES: thioredoxin family protein [Chromohalobacter]MCI0509696.1 thioredoxin family protein [Chromohalobacter sp.]MCI0593341.1 thioredoxin family protein [Chromohalobacter sp.]TDU21918.1 AhpC/TSA family protein [Chromohalobacter marismortui]